MSYPHQKLSVKKNPELYLTIYVGPVGPPPGTGVSVKSYVGTAYGVPSPWWAGIERGASHTKNSMPTMRAGRSKHHVPKGIKHCVGERGTSGHMQFIPSAKASGSGSVDWQGQSVTAEL